MSKNENKMQQTMANHECHMSASKERFYQSFLFGRNVILLLMNVMYKQA